VSTVVFLIGGNNLNGWSALYTCRLLSQFGHKCLVYAPDELELENLELFNFLKHILTLPNVEAAEPADFPQKIDLLVCGLFGDFKIKAWFMELQDNLSALKVKQKLITAKNIVY
jgi:NAD(P)H-hydrate repair Nnr-like enzyme with NAD(P)H-hydrate epimerase domain